MTFPKPDITAISKPYWDSLREGVLLFQECPSCTHRWLPPRAACPNCLDPNPRWRPSSGQGQVVSWVVYHHAYADHLKSCLPYDVTVVELEEGPRLLTNVIDSQAGQALSVGLPVELAVERVEDIALARFRRLPEGARP
ncbi:Zn-ribbon domain-containing OB-fold protein [Rhodovibrionaceae bacterium A322]